MIERIKHALREQDWRQATTIVAVNAVAVSMACAIRLPDDASLFLPIALVGVLVAMYSEARE